MCRFINVTTDDDHAGLQDLFTFTEDLPSLPALGSKHVTHMTLRVQHMTCSVANGASLVKPQDGVALCAHGLGILSSIFLQALNARAPACWSNDRSCCAHPPATHAASLPCSPEQHSYTEALPRLTIRRGTDSP
eukprot:3019686-Amphidinium_carterae.1